MKMKLNIILLFILMTAERVCASNSKEKDTDCQTCLDTIPKRKKWDFLLDLILVNHVKAYVIPCQPPGSNVKHRVHHKCAFDWIIEYENTTCPCCRTELANIDQVRKKLKRDPIIQIPLKLVTRMIRFLCRMITFGSFQIIKQKKIVSKRIRAMRNSFCSLINWISVLQEDITKLVAGIYPFLYGKYLETKTTATQTIDPFQWKLYVDNILSEVQKGLLKTHSNEFESTRLYQYEVSREFQADKWSENINNDVDIDMEITIRKNEVLESSFQIAHGMKNKKMIAYSRANSAFIVIEKSQRQYLKEKKNKMMIVSSCPELEFIYLVNQQILKKALAAIRYDISIVTSLIPLSHPLFIFLIYDGTFYWLYSLFIYICLLLIPQLLFINDDPPIFVYLYLTRNYYKWIRLVSQNTYQKFYAQK